MSIPFQGLPEGFSASSDALFGNARAALAGQQVGASEADALNRLPGGSNAQSQWLSEKPQPPQGLLGRAKAWMTTPGTGGTSNGDGGAEEDPHQEINDKLDGINDRLDSIQGQQQAAPSPVQNRMEAFSQWHQGGPIASGQQQPGVQSPLTADFAAQRYAQQMYAQGVHEQMSNARSGLQMRQQSYAAQTPQGVSPMLSGNAQSASQGSNTMNGLVGAGNGNAMSESTYQNKKWGQS